MNKIIICFVIMIGFTLNFVSASNDNITKEKFDNFTNTNKLEHMDILRIQKELQNVTVENRIAVGNISERLDKISVNLTTLSQNFEKEQGIAVDLTVKIALFTMIISVVLAIITLIISAVLALPKKKNEKSFVRPLQIMLVVFIIGTLFGYLPNAIMSTNPPKPFDIFTPHSDWLGWIIGIIGIIIGLFGISKQKWDSKKTAVKENNLIVDSLRKYNHSIQVCRKELEELQKIVQDDVKNGGDGLNALDIELQKKSDDYLEWFNQLDKESSFVRQIMGDARFYDALNNGIGAFRIITEVNETAYPNAAIWLNKVEESISMIDAVKAKTDAELIKRLPKDQLPQ